MAITNIAAAPLPVNYNLMRQLLVTAKTRAPFFAGTNQAVLVKNAGTLSVKWERIENLNAVTTPLSELTGAESYPTRTSTQPTITPITATMQKYGDFIAITEDLDVSTVNARASKFMDTLGEQVGKSYNMILAAAYAAGFTGTSIRYGGGVAGVTSIVTAMSSTDEEYAQNFVDRNGGQTFYPMSTGSTNINTSPVRASFMGICHVDVEIDIRRIPGFVPVEQYGSQTQTYPGEFGISHGVRWCSTQTSSLITAGAATTSAAGFRGTSNILNDVYDSYVIGMDAVGTVGLGEAHTREAYVTGDRIPAVQVISKAMGSAGTADPLDEIATVGWKGWLVGKVLNANFGVRIRTLASAL